MRPIQTAVLYSSLLTAIPASALTWNWSNPTPHGNNIVDMAWNGYQSVQVTEVGQIYTGVNFLGWLPQVSGTTNDFQAVTFFGNRIVVAGANLTFGYSDDGVNFTTTNLDITQTDTNWITGLAASPSLAVAVGDNAVIYTSTDGATWQYRGQAPNNPNGDWLLSAAYGAGVFVIAGEGGYLATSTDGVNWTTHNSGVTNDIERVAWISATNASGTFPYTGFWAVTSTYSYPYVNNTGRSWASYSTNNGVNWILFNLTHTNVFGTNMVVQQSTNILYGVTANNSTGLIVGDSEVGLGQMVLNRVDWRSQTQTGSNGPAVTDAPVWTYYTALWDTNGVYRLAGDDGMLVEGAPAVTNGNNYSWQIQYNSVRDWLWQVTLAGELYVAVGDHSRIVTSDNGGVWDVEALSFTNSITSTNTVFFGVNGNTNLLVAVGSRGSLAISPNTFTNVVLTNLDGSLSTNSVGTLGVLWSSMPAPLGTTNDLAGVGVFGTNFYIAGANATMFRTSDGTNWAPVSVPAAGGKYISGFDASSNALVAVGDRGLILTSPDGATWTQRTSNTTNWLFRVRCINGRFLAVGENGTIRQSTDNGATWFSAVSGTTNWLNDAVMISNTCYIVGNNGTVLSSTNFTNWTGIGTITALSLYGAATQFGQLVVVGLQGTILRSQVVPNLNYPIAFYSYFQSSNQNIFNVVGYPDQKFTFDSSSNLVNWSTGPQLDLVYPDGTLEFITTLGTNPPPTLYYRLTLVP